MVSIFYIIPLNTMVVFGGSDAGVSVVMILELKDEQQRNKNAETEATTKK